MNRPRISIIIPVYNADNYLKQCLDSIEEQTFVDWECILVDDGSTDSSADICGEYGARNEKFKLVRKTNGGVSSARNIGIEKAIGKWIFFSDADDTLDTLCLELLYEAVDDNTSFVWAGYTKLYETGAIKESYPKSDYCEITTNDAIKEIYQPTILSYQGYLWCKLFRADIIKNNKLSFNEHIYFNEDRLFIIKYLCNLQGLIKYTTSSVYNYIERVSGAVNSVNLYYNKKFVTDFDAYVLMRNEVYSYTNDKNLRHLSNEGVAFSYIANHEMMYKHKHYDAATHWRLFKVLFNTGAFWCLFSGPLIKIMKNMFFVFTPQLIKLLTK